jgi:hypothetical protein
MRQAQQALRCYRRCRTRRRRPPRSCLLSRLAAVAAAAAVLAPECLRARAKGRFRSATRRGRGICPTRWCNPPPPRLMVERDRVGKHPPRGSHNTGPHPPKRLNKPPPKRVVRHSSKRGNRHILTTNGHDGGGVAYERDQDPPPRPPCRYLSHRRAVRVRVWRALFG